MAEFSFDRYELDMPNLSVHFFYSIKLDDKAETFKETLTYPQSKLEEWKAIPTSLLEGMCETLHLVLGMSYWKMYCPNIIKHPYQHNQEQATFWNTLYTKGLGEFFFKNKIDFRGLINFPTLSDQEPTVPASFPRTDRCLVPFGGGKDSIVTSEILKACGKNITLFTLGTSSIQEKGIEIVDRPHYFVDRHIDPKVFELNKSGNVYNGHIPISSIYLFTGLLSCLLTDTHYLVFSNERSANIGNVDYLDMEINHQWSKSGEFEELAQNYIQTYLTKDIIFFSFLRPWSELDVVRQFCQYPQYFQTFSSCNSNFKLQDISSTGRNPWCGHCPKCAFVFAILRAFLPRETVQKIFGQNLFEKHDLVKLYSELLGLSDFKPFECVGAPEETAYALYLAHQKNPDERNVIMNMFVERVLSNKTEAEWNELKQTLLDHSETKTIPTEFKICYDH